MQGLSKQLDCQRSSRISQPAREAALLGTSGATQLRLMQLIAHALDRATQTRIIQGNVRDHFELERLCLDLFKAVDIFGMTRGVIRPEQLHFNGVELQVQRDDLIAQPVRAD